MFITQKKYKKEIADWILGVLDEYISRLKSDFMDIILAHFDSESYKQLSEYKMLVEENNDLRKRLEQVNYDRAIKLAEKEFERNIEGLSFLECFTKAYDYLLFLDVLGKNKQDFKTDTNQNITK